MSQPDIEAAPRYQMFIDEEQRYLELEVAGRTYDSGWASVRIGGLVLEANGNTRPITDKEQGDIVRIADEWSDMK